MVWNQESIKMWLKNATEYLKLNSDFISSFPKDAKIADIDHKKLDSVALVFWFSTSFIIYANLIFPTFHHSLLFLRCNHSTSLQHCQFWSCHMRHSCHLSHLLLRVVSSRTSLVDFLISFIFRLLLSPGQKTRYPL